MSYEQMKIISIETSVNRDSGEQRVYVNVEEANPKNWRVNLSNKSADQINQLTKLQGQTVMLPSETGMYNGRAYMRLLDDPIIPMASQPSTEELQQEKQAANELAEELAKPEKPKKSGLFSESSKK